MNDVKNNNDDNNREFVIDKLTLEQILTINTERNHSLIDNYDPIAGTAGSIDRLPFTALDDDGNPVTLMLPVTMVRELETLSAVHRTTDLDWQRLRIAHDFEYWCARCVKILDKTTGRIVPFVLNRPQRRVLQVLEQQRLDNRPLRIILLKARQWGGSTLIQMYMAWIQLVHRKNWNSLIIGHIRQTASAIKGMYSRLLRNYPVEFTHYGKRPTLTTFEHSVNVQQLSEGESLVIAGTAQSQDAIRGYDVKMAHMTEVAFWPTSPMHSPHDVVRSIGGTVPLEPYSMLVLESTANGMGDFFHNEWQRAKDGNSDKVPIFVPWYEIEIYRMDVDSPQELISSLNDYEKSLWERGCTLEMINWYHNKRTEYPSHALMVAEFPTTDIEAFTGTGYNVFNSDHLERLLQDCNMTPQQGDIVASADKSLAGISFVEGDNGPLQVWKMPQKSLMRNRYVVVVDVGGRSDKADWSVIAVFDRKGGLTENMPEVVAQWRSHIDHDRLAWKAAQIATFYNNALLVIESNTLECEGTLGSYILNEMMINYRNLYIRTNKNGERKPGFQTGVDTKVSAINALIAYVRDAAYIERSPQAVAEMAYYELKPGSRASYGAREGKHDDIVMTRAIGLLVIHQETIRNLGSKAITPTHFITTG